MTLIQWIKSRIARRHPNQIADSAARRFSVGVRLPQGGIEVFSVRCTRETAFMAIRERCPRGQVLWVTDTTDPSVPCTN